MEYRSEAYEKWGNTDAYKEYLETTSGYKMYAFDERFKNNIDKNAPAPQSFFQRQ